jgi:hypothetical protein
MRKAGIAIVLSLAIAGLIAGSPVFAQKVENAQAQVVQQPKGDYSRLAAALEQSGMPYQKLQDHWTISLGTKENPIQIVIVPNPDPRVISMVYSLGNIPEGSAEKLAGKLAELNDNYLFVKFVNMKGNLLLRIDMLVYGLDGDILKFFTDSLLKAVQDEIKGIRDVVGVAAPKPGTEKPKEKGK